MQRDLWLDKGKNLLMHLRSRFNAPPVAVQSSVWYSGLGIEPAQFSEQLARLQTSLNCANAPVIDDAARKAAAAHSSFSR
jgi:hypothetical protein